jgi:hypothetical protein
MPPELAYLTPALEVIVGIFALLKRDDLCKVAKEQRESPSGSDYSDGHIMLVEDKHITVQPGFELANHHISYLDSAAQSDASEVSRTETPYHSAIAASLS